MSEAMTVEQALRLSCDTCGADINDMPWHYSEGENRHLHACDGCWPMVRAALSRPAVPAVEDERPLRQTIIDVLTATRGESEGLTADAILSVLPHSHSPTPAPAVPEGCKLVPVEPTDEMCEALEECLRDHGFDHDGIGELSKAACWDAMLAAAPPTQEEQT